MGHPHYSRLRVPSLPFFFFFFNDTATTEIYTLSLHDALPICLHGAQRAPLHVGNLLEGHAVVLLQDDRRPLLLRSEEHTSELQSLRHLVCRLLLEKKKQNHIFRN